MGASHRCKCYADCHTNTNTKFPIRLHHIIEVICHVPRLHLRRSRSRELPVAVQSCTQTDITMPNMGGEELEWGWGPNSFGTTATKVQEWGPRFACRATPASMLNTTKNGPWGPWRVTIQCEVFGGCQTDVALLKGAECATSPILADIKAPRTWIERVGLAKTVLMACVTWVLCNCVTWVLCKIRFPAQWELFQGHGRSKNRDFGKKWCTYSINQFPAD